LNPSLNNHLKTTRYEKAILGFRKRSETVFNGYSVEQFAIFAGKCPLKTVRVACAGNWLKSSGKDSGLAKYRKTRSTGSDTKSNYSHTAT